MKKTVNSRVACEPLPQGYTTVRTEMHGRISLLKNKGLVPLQVIFSSDKYAPGDVVYVRGDVTHHPWSKEVYEVDDVKFVLVPEEFVVMVDKEWR